MAARYIHKEVQKQATEGPALPVVGAHGRPSRFVVKKVLERPFYEALAKIESGEAEAACSLISHRRFNVNETNENGQTLLMAACAAGQRAVVQALLSEGISVNAVDMDHWSALMVASKEGHCDIVTDLLNADADMELHDSGNWTALMWACYKGRSDVASALLRHGANCDVKGQHNMTCLIWAAGRGHKDIVEDLVQHGAIVDMCDKHGTSPLIWAARKGHMSVVNILLQRGANVNIVGMHSLTALLAALSGGYREVARALLTAKPNVNVIDQDSASPLAIAAREGYEEIVCELLDLGAYVNVVDKAGDSVLIHAVKGGHISIVKTLLRRNADIDVAGNDERTALYCAVDKGYIDIFKLLLSQNPNKEIPDKDGNTPLLRAVRNRNLEMTDILLERGAKVSACDKKGDSALHIAMRARGRRMVELLLKNPRNSRLLYVRNKVGETPYSLDAGQQRSLLTQIFGARSLNDAETVESQLGYELYSSALADVLSSPTLATPMTVGLYAKWGSGKSFMLSKLREDMTAFTRNATNEYFTLSWLTFAISFISSFLIGLMTSLAWMWEAGVPIGFGLFVLLYMAQGLLWYGDNRRGWLWATEAGSYVASGLRRLELILKLLYCNRPPPPDTGLLSGISFIFAESAKLTSLGGIMSLATMVGSLYESAEKRYGIVITRLFRVFGSHTETSVKYKKICCLPAFVIVIFVVSCLVAGVGLAVRHFREPTLDTDDIAHYSAMGTLGAIVLVALLASAHTLARAVHALAWSSRQQVIKACRGSDGGLGHHNDQLVQRLKAEIQLLSSMVVAMDRFTGWQTRLVLVVDGLDSCEQDKVLQVLDTMSLVISEESLPFIVLLALDPHIIIKGIEANLNKVFQDSSLNGHAYLRNIVHLPFYLQNHGLPLMTTGTTINVTSETPRQGTAKDNLLPEVKSSKYMSRPRLERQTSLWSSQTSVTGERGIGGRPYFSSTLGLHASHAGIADETEQVHRTIAKGDYFVDISPRSIRRLMNIIAVAGRLLRANEIEFNWYRLSAWINITEQWPYRTSWLLLYYEECEGKLDDNMSLKVIYEKIAARIPTSREFEPLLDVDKNDKKFVAFLSSHNPKLNVSDIRKFMPATINLDPFIRKLIKDKLKESEAIDAFAPPFGAYVPHTSEGALLRPATVPSSQPRSPFPSAAAMVSPYYYPWYSGAAPPLTPAVLPEARILQNMRSPASVLSPHARALVPQGYRSLLSLSTEDVCCLLSEIKGISAERIPSYKQNVRDNNLSGLVLLQCDLDELKPILKMAFGDWQLFKTVVEVLRLGLELPQPMVVGIASSGADALAGDGKQASPVLKANRAIGGTSSGSVAIRTPDEMPSQRLLGSIGPQRQAAGAAGAPADHQQDSASASAAGSGAVLRGTAAGLLSLPQQLGLGGGGYPATSKPSATSHLSTITGSSHDSHATTLSRKDSSLDCIMMENRMIFKAMHEFAEHDLSEESEEELDNDAQSVAERCDDGTNTFEDAFQSALTSEPGHSGEATVRFTVAEDQSEMQPLLEISTKPSQRPHGIP